MSGGSAVLSAALCGPGPGAGRRGPPTPAGGTLCGRASWHCPLGGAGAERTMPRAPEARADPRARVLGPVRSPHARTGSGPPAERGACARAAPARNLVWHRRLFTGLSTRPGFCLRLLRSRGLCVDRGPLSPASGPAGSGRQRPPLVLAFLPRGALSWDLCVASAARPPWEGLPGQVTRKARQGDRPRPAGSPEACSGGPWLRARSRSPELRADLRPFQNWSRGERPPQRPWPSGRPGGVKLRWSW